MNVIALFVTDKDTISAVMSGTFSGIPYSVVIATVDLITLSISY